MQYYLGLDQGTTGTTALLFNEEWKQLATSHAEHRQFYPSPGWVEHDPNEIWRCVLQTIRNVLKAAGISPEQLTCIGLANQGETVMLWDCESGQPVCPAVVWQDRRTAAWVDDLTKRCGTLLRERTGLIPDAYFSASKIRWMMDHVSGMKERISQGKILAGTLDTWMMWKLTGGKTFATDCSTASRTMLMNLRQGDWDEEILSELEIPKHILPTVHPSFHGFGMTDPSVFFGASVPITGSLVDQQAALFGQACFAPGTVKTTYGTGSFMLMNTGDRPVFSKHGLLTTVAWRLDDGTITYALDGGAYCAGAAIQWLRDKLNMVDHAAETADAARSVPDTGGVYVVPAFSGLAAPQWDPYARGTIIGLTGGTERSHIIRATLESIAYQVKDILDVMEQDSGVPIHVMRADGGAVSNEFLMQFQADILGIPVEIPEISETTALGAAFMAALGVGAVANTEALTQTWKLRRRYEPRMDENTRAALLHQWHRAVERSKGWIEK
ncbi:MAG: glycerol kinase GlpK [Lawsonibacter sp.]